MKFLGFIPALFLVTACATAPANQPSTEDVITPVAPGLMEREPDICGATEYARFIGQPQSILDSLTIARKYRVTEFGGIVTQEYNAYRINFALAADGTISAVSCG